MYAMIGAMYIMHLIFSIFYLIITYFFCLFNLKYLIRYLLNKWLLPYLCHLVRSCYRDALWSKIIGHMLITCPNSLSFGSEFYCVNQISTKNFIIISIQVFSFQICEPDLYYHTVLVLFMIQLWIHVHSDLTWATIESITVSR